MLFRSPDFVVFDGNANDSYTRITDDPIKLGTITNGFNETLDNTTYCGGFETICKTLLEKYRGARIIYVAVHKLVGRDFGAQEKLHELSREICKKWCIEYVNLYEESGLNTFIESYKNEYSYDTLSDMKNGSGTHPNEEGYRKFYMPKIIGVMKNKI